MKTIIFHNPRCSKSREALELLENREENIKVIKYLEAIPTRAELENILSLLNIKPIDLVRKKEAIWIEKYKNQQLSDSQIVDAMLENPRLIERPIVIKGNKAAIGRPIENIVDIL